MPHSWNKPDDRGALITFGIEIEFLVSWLPPNYKDPDPKDKRDARIGTPLDSFKGLEMQSDISQRNVSRSFRYRIPDLGAAPYADREDPESGDEDDDYTMEGPHIRHRMAKCLRDHGIPAVSDSGDEETEAVLREHWEKTAAALGYKNKKDMPRMYDLSTVWAVDTDSSLSEKRNISCRRSAIEIKSPVFYYDEKSISLVQYVVNLLTSKFRTFVNGSCMFHVHVGRGDVGFTNNDLRSK